MKTLYNMNNVYNTSQNDWLSASKAVGFAHHDPNRYSNNASGFEFRVPPSIGGNGVPSQNDWLSATKANGFSHLLHGGRSLGMSKVGQEDGTNFMPRGSDIKGGSKDDIYSDIKTGLKKTGKFLNEHNEKLKKSKIISTTARNALGGNPVGNTIADLTEMLGYGKASLANTAGSVITSSSKLGSKDTEFMPRGSDTTLPQRGGASENKTSTPFQYTKLYTGNYNMPSVKGPPLLYGNTTLGLVPDLGTNLQPLRQAYFHSGL